jgi:hypothetical protein
MTTKKAFNIAIGCILSSKLEPTEKIETIEQLRMAEHMAKEINKFEKSINKEE